MRAEARTRDEKPYAPTHSGALTHTVSVSCFIRFSVTWLIRAQNRTNREPSEAEAVDRRVHDGTVEVAGTSAARVVPAERTRPIVADAARAQEVRIVATTCRRKENMGVGQRV